MLTAEQVASIRSAPAAELVHETRARVGCTAKEWFCVRYLCIGLSYDAIAAWVNEITLACATFGDCLDYADRLHPERVDPR